MEPGALTIIFAAGFVCTIVGFAFFLATLRAISAQPPKSSKFPLWCQGIITILGLSLTLLAFGLKFESFFSVIMPLYIGLPLACISLLVALTGGIKMYMSGDDMAGRAAGWKRFQTSVMFGAIGAAIFLTGPILHEIFYSPTH
ncbi:hypothetical protein HN358_03830 [Candidatus Uhrbacteria bacterium]|nr:hypothetical protein [Candidatus Uhrbacteria bacterium]MBT7717651.1 hypothetical protein [Candidatus Uhrbacteria bacterium]